ncbi:MAG: MerR family transcriptional regulator [Gammaproteobacteria bacterium]|nr:MerR family transcriptional regulator [Gammaproteobacteria bacterium]
MNPTTRQKVPTTKPNRLFRGTGWDISVAEYVSKTRSEFQRVSDLVNKKIHTVKDSGATYRVINHWAEAGLIEDKSRKTSEGWRRLSFLDLVWIKVLADLRKFGVPLESLKIARRAIFEVPGKPSVTRPEFEYAVTHCLAIDPARFLLVSFSDGWAEVIDQTNFELCMSSGHLNTKSYLVIDLNQCCKAVLPNMRLPQFRVKHELTDKELSIIESVRSGRYDVVEIHGSDGKIERIKCRSRKGRAASKLDQLARSMEFGEFTVKVQKGKAVLTEVIESIKA